MNYRELKRRYVRDVTALKLEEHDAKDQGREVIASQLRHAWRGVEKATYALANIIEREKRDEHQES